MSDLVEMKLRLEALESELLVRVSTLEERVESLESRAHQGRRSNAQINVSAVIDPSVTIVGSVATPSKIGSGVKIYRDSELVGRIVVGDGTFINRSAYLRDRVTLGKNVNLGPFVRMLTDGHQIGAATRRAGQNSTQPITVGDGAWIGAGATILGGVTIGEGAIVAAGAVVTSDVPPHTVAAGVPARFARLLE